MVYNPQYIEQVAGRIVIQYGLNIDMIKRCYKVDEEKSFASFNRAILIYNDNTIPVFQVIFR